MYRFLKPACIESYNRRTRTLLRLFCNRRSFYHVKDRDPGSSVALLRNLTTDEALLVKQYCSCTVLGNSFQNDSVRTSISLPIDDLHEDSKMDDLLQDIDVKCTNNRNQAMKKSKHELINDMVNKKLMSYVEFCVECDFLHFAYNAIDRHVKKHRYDRVTRITTPRPFVKLMSGFAAKGDLPKVVELMKMMNSCDIDPTPSTYACYLECFGRNGIVPTDDQFEIVTDGCRSLGLTLAELESQMTCSSVDGREYTLKAICSVYPEFVPLEKSPAMRYSNSLVRELNEKPKLFRAPYEGLLSGEKMDKLADEQIYNELEFVNKIESFGKRAKNDGWDAILHSWRSAINKGFEENLEREEKSLQQRLLSYGPNIIPYLKYLNVDQYTDILLTEVCLLLQDYELRQKDLMIRCIRLGDIIVRRCKTECIRRNGKINTMISLYKDYCCWLIGSKPDEISWNARRRWQGLINENFNINPLSDEVDESLLSREIGEFLYRILMENLLFKVEKGEGDSLRTFWLKVFSKRFSRRRQYYIEMVEAHPKILQLMPGDFFMIHNTSLPMLSPPIPKISPDSGGFVLHGDTYVKSMQAVYDSLRLVPKERLYPVFDAINVVSSVPWQINKPILELMHSVFDNGGSNKFDIPNPLSKFSPDDEYVSMLCKNENISNEELKSTITMLMGRTHRLWLEMLHRLLIAREYRDRIFWLPHVFNNRGRIMCTLPYLNHFGGDLNRALMKFAKGVKLGPRGFEWLKIHCVNLSGEQAFGSIKQKLEYFDKTLPDILDSANEPLTGKLWWTKSENKWQMLACCMEIKAVLDSGDTENFISYLPVHRDGTCNVLQHFAALARDPVAGEYANLTPSARPQDVYTNIIGLMEYNRRQKAEQGDEKAQSIKGYLHRKNIKPLIIAWLNGCPYEKLVQVATKMLRKRNEIPSSSIKLYGAYIVDQLIEQISEKFLSCRNVMTWLMNCSEVITNELDDVVEWETPIGFPVQQPYIINFTAADKAKQIKAFPPNFIQSLEATHMMLTSLYCERAGITFVSVFDCFWTHAGSVDVMDKICREQFVAMHSQPVLENLSTFFINKYAADTPLKDGKHDISEKSPLHVFTRVPPKSVLDLNLVLESKYFFS